MIIKMDGDQCMMHAFCFNQKHMMLSLKSDMQKGSFFNYASFAIKNHLINIPAILQLILK